MLASNFSSIKSKALLVVLYALRFRYGHSICLRVANCCSVAFSVVMVTYLVLGILINVVPSPETIFLGTSKWSILSLVVLAVSADVVQRVEKSDFWKTGRDGECEFYSLLFLIFYLDVRFLAFCFLHLVVLRKAVFIYRVIN